MEIKTIEEAKERLGRLVKFVPDDDVSVNLRGLKVLSGALIKITSNWEYTKDGDVCVSFQNYIDVIDPIDDGLHHICAKTIFTDDVKDDDVINATENEELAKLQRRMDEILASIKAK
jgi:hypothetical protein